MKTLALPLLVFSFSAPALASSVSCSGSSISYVSNTYEGGAPPSPILVVYRDAWIVDGKPVATLERQANGVDKRTGMPGIFDESTRVVIDDSHAKDKPTGILVTSITASATDVQGVPHTEKMSCRAIYPTLPRP